MTLILTHIKESPNLNSVIIEVAGALLMFSSATNMYSLGPVQAQPSPWPGDAHFWALVNKVGGSSQPEFTGCYAEVLIVFMVDVGALKKYAIVLTKDQNLCTLLQTTFILGHQGEFRAKLRSDLPLPADQGLGARGKLFYDLISVCVRC